MAARRGNPTWIKGRSGNPGGRPKALREMTELAREKGPEAIEFLTRVVRDESELTRHRIRAAELLLDRGYGKPSQTVHTNVARSFAELSDEELIAIAMGASVEDEDDASSEVH